MKKMYFLIVALCLFTTTKAQIVNIPDANFKAKLLAASSSSTIAKDLAGNYFKIDANSDGEIQISEAQNVTWLTLKNLNISSLEGLSNFINLNFLDIYGIFGFNSLDLSSLTNLKYLTCNSTSIVELNLSGLKKLQTLEFSNNSKLTSLIHNKLNELQTLKCETNYKLTSLNLNGFDKLKEIVCRDNEKLTSLNLTRLTSVTSLICNDNDLQSLVVSDLVNLTYLDCSFNEYIFNLDVSNLKKLTYLSCGVCGLGSLNVNGLTNLETLYCQYNSISKLDTFGLTNLKNLNCTNNNITSLDLSGLMKLDKLVCGQGILKYLNIKNNSKETILDLYGIGIGSMYICCDDNQITQVENIINRDNCKNCNVNTYCSFVPGGEYFDIKGNTKVDNNNNGCDVEDTNYPNFKFNITNSTISGSLISDASGNYSIPVQTGIHTMTPVLENPSYFNISPTNTVVTFPTQTSPFTQDFCVTANGVHPDLEVAVLPITRARPGFDASYKIIYKNKGTDTQSGAVNFKFNDAVLDLVSANPVVSNQTVNNLSWDFTNLNPFETREIIVTVNINGPMETPAVNGGDTLDFTTTITSTLTDETPTDNTFTLNQTVVNAFDPNDKTCLEGTTIPPSAVGKYVHYLIRFENKGTAEAQNVVVKDMIDTSKFDVSSLVVTQGSHSFVTRITETNKVEFIFENINLPFDDTTNDGYVAFKIKTKPSLVVGDSFSNTASIYFDYNFPIVTNTATTSVLQNLGNQDFFFDSYFKTYPNPVKEVLNIDVKRQIEVTSISIFNMLGQQILVIPNAQQTKQVDVSSLQTGNYFIKVNTNKGISNAKFIKN